MKWTKREPAVPYSLADSMKEKLIKIHGIEEPDRFFNPASDELHDPRLLKNIDLAGSRIMKAIHNNEKISIYADADFDGCVSCTIMYRYLRHYTEQVSYFHAQRSEGHGIEKAKDRIPQGTNLLIIVDSSSDEPEACREIAERGIDIIILDHHAMSSPNPYCILVNPQQEGCLYPNKSASGSLVSWKICNHLDDRMGDNRSGLFIDLAGTGIYSDQMSMLEYENRYIVREALDNISNPGLRTALDMMGRRGELSATDIGYSITSYVNAATRMDRMEIILALLTEDDPAKAGQIAKKANKLNKERKKIQREALKRIIPAIDSSSRDQCTVIVDTRLGRGFNGLIAGELARLYQRPFIILGESRECPEQYCGSFRAAGAFPLLDYIRALPEVVHSGGHQTAGGVCINKSNLESFRRSLNEALGNQCFEPMAVYELELNADAITAALIHEIKDIYRLTGKDFNEAKFLVRNVIVLEKSHIGDGDVLRLELALESEHRTEKLSRNPFALEAIKFRADREFAAALPLGIPIEIIGTLNINKWIRRKPGEAEAVNQIIIDSWRTNC
ncbi:DHH family phosphoesterase [Paenibacillus oenotherae]|uniref:DHH family phosphoesterase n=1 Tax=Paenibacillus oenotherae TaxID=1435645 RepID=A0ABS7D2I1_9BACL|nr:DHH family phosphoesterase [Paenibacillus oenotherae]MBW7474061.1 DHH family phosphoesterase [Paenibacillus oenotherae]